VPRSIIDDLSEKDVSKGFGGYPILFQNRAIRDMLKLAKAGSDDIVCDLGCGLGQNLIIAASEFNVRRAVGYEQNKSRAEKATKRFALKGLAGVCEVFNEKYEKALRGESRKFRLEDATIVFFGLGTTTSIFRSLKKRLRDRCRLVYTDDCLFPEIMPNKIDFPFYLSKLPFDETTSQFEWLRRVVGKERSLIHRGNKPEAEELWDELRHDHRHFSGSSRVTEYRQRFQRLKIPP
jgi:hypothetical protein